MGDRLGIHGAVDIFLQMKQADLIIRFRLVRIVKNIFFAFILTVLLEDSLKIN